MRKQDDLKPWSCEFQDSTLEASYHNAMQGQTVQHIRISMSVVAVLFLLFGLVDLIMMGLGGNFYLLLAMRVLVALSCALLVSKITDNPSLEASPVPLNAVCFLLITSLILIVPLRPETLESQVTAVVAVSIAIYLFIPNRLPWMIGLNAYLGAGFLLALYFLGDLSLNNTLTAALVVLLPNVIGLLTARRLNRLQREQFASLMSEQETNRLLQKEIRKRQRMAEEMQLLAQTDDLTGLNNRRWFLELAGQELRHARRRNTPMALCMMDLDHFKSINDYRGHAAGDRVLEMVAQLCREELRDSDIIGRFGGEEFIIALPDATPEAALEIAERLRMRIEQAPLPQNYDGIHLTVTVGITQIEDWEDDLEQALLRADKALYQGKNQGRNRVIMFQQAA